MATEYTDSDIVSRPPAPNPFHLLDQLYNAIIGIDKILSPYAGQAAQKISAAPDRRRLIYLRNTLAVSLDLWQDDIRQRISRSRGTFYTYCMTEGERAAFLRRMVPAFAFAAEELRAIDAAILGPFAGVIEQAGLNVEIYCEQNRACLKTGLACENEYPFLTCSIIPLPRVEDVETAQDNRPSGPAPKRQFGRNLRPASAEKKRLVSTG